MTTKQEAYELFLKFRNICIEGVINNTPTYLVLIDKQAKEMTLIAVDKILSILPTIDYDKQSEDFEFFNSWYLEVKEEIKKIDNTYGKTKKTSRLR
jgi:hypothetical protein